MGGTVARLSFRDFTEGWHLALDPCRGVLSVSSEYDDVGSVARRQHARHVTAPRELVAQWFCLGDFAELHRARRLQGTKKNSDVERIRVPESIQHNGFQKQRFMA